MAVATSADPARRPRQSGSTSGQAARRPERRRALLPALRVATVDDPLEREADRTADRVMRMSNTGRTSPPASFDNSANGEVRRRSADSTRSRPTSIRHGVTGGPGEGTPLSPAERAFFEPRFGYDFSAIRIHSGTAAAASARMVNARAYTVGRSIVLGEGARDRQTHDGRRLLAHELAHSVQQGAVTPVNAADSAGERRGPAGLRRQEASVGPVVQRQGENLTATRFAGNAMLEGALDNTKVVSRKDNSSGTHVRLIQESLLAQGYTLPVHGADGDFGTETEAAVRSFQIDAGAVKLDGIVGPETMGLLDMHDPGGTSGAPPVAPGTPPATAAAFSEAASEPFAGYDASVSPNWLVVPTSGRRRADVAITPAVARPTYVSDTPATATVAPTTNGIVVTGAAAGTARIQARAGATVLDTLRITVKDRKDVSVAFHYVSDSRPPAAGGPHSSNGTPSADEMRSLLNRVWERQANVRLTGGASHNIVVPGDMGPYVNSDGFGGGEMGVVTAAAPAPAAYNVFRVWQIRSQHAAVNDALNNGSNTVIGDSPCADGLGLPHECGHFLGLGHGSGFIMTPCGGRTDQRVSKAMADIVNP